MEQATHHQHRQAKVIMAVLDMELPRHMLAEVAAVQAQLVKQDKLPWAVLAVLVLRQAQT
jgi:hypothetical protein